MSRSKYIMAKVGRGTLFLSIVGFVALFQTAMAQQDDTTTRVYSPVVNGEALRGLSTVGSAESMGEGRITFGVMSPWYRQQKEYFNTPNGGANLYTVAGAFSYGVNSHFDVFGSIAAFSSNHYTKNDKSSGLGTIRAGVQGSIPFPSYSFLRVGGQTSIIGGTSANQINTFRADGYNYFETRTGYSVMGKILQTIQFGTEDVGFKAHLNEAGVFGLTKSQPSLLCLGAGLQANMHFAVIATELNSRTQFNSAAFKTDPLWFTPSFTIRTPYNMNISGGVDISLSADRSGGQPRSLEPYRVFGSFAFSMDMLAGRRNAEMARKEKAAQEKAVMERNARQSDKKVTELTNKSINDSLYYANEQEIGMAKMDSMQEKSDMMDKQASTDSIALDKAAGDLAFEKEKRSDAEKQLLTSGELLLDAVYFESDGSILTINSKPYLNIIGKMLVKYPKLQIEVAGHTDNIGNVNYNVDLSQKRAEAVRFYLIKIEPSLGSFLNARGYGMSIPKSANETKEGRQDNRRVELRVLNKDVLKEYSEIAK